MKKTTYILFLLLASCTAFAYSPPLVKPRITGGNLPPVLVERTLTERLCYTFKLRCQPR